LGARRDSAMASLPAVIGREARTGSSDSDRQAVRPCTDVCCRTTSEPAAARAARLWLRQRCCCCTTHPAAQPTHRHAPACRCRRWLLLVLLLLRPVLPGACWWRP
jgi:hypothetical protein